MLTYHTPCTLSGSTLSIFCYILYFCPYFITRRKFEAIMDDMSPEEILAQAQAAAREAAVELTMRKPDSKVNDLYLGFDLTLT